MDRRVLQAIDLLKEAGHLDLLAAPVAPRKRPVRRAVSGVAGAVVACSPPRERTQGRQSGSADGDPGELVAGSEPWEEEEVLAGPSTASWTGYRGSKALRAKDLVKQRSTGPGFAPHSGRVSEGTRPG
ncbi:hypothetical protein NDU88_000199 [Pleurodeles waltl]|uniref:Uncharacterized protein n=1 Tax=Pleurodeles waltl TaxID=8319 RepID=A0AAV7TGF4_PLEWA|nr:hypothetical protein NDU88_000199 [Pleurodeles waltl]